MILYCKKNIAAQTINLADLVFIPIFVLKLGCNLSIIFGNYLTDHYSNSHYTTEDRSAVAIWNFIPFKNNILIGSNVKNVFGNYVKSAKEADIATREVMTCSLFTLGSLLETDRLRYLSYTSFADPL